jgi:opacity protein-like surface antigen
MKTYLIAAAAAVPLLLSSCAAAVSTRVEKAYPATDYHTEVKVFDTGDSIQSSAERIGTIKIGDSGFSGFVYLDEVIEKAKTEARKIGGDALLITTQKPPSLWGSSVHRITADILRMDTTAAVPLYINPYFNTAPSQLRIAVDGGWGYRTAEEAKGLPKGYVDDLRGGFNWGGEITGFVSERSGIGLTYSEHRAGIGKSYEQVWKEDITLRYIGPHYMLRCRLPKKSSVLLMGFGLGYLSYQDKGKLRDGTPLNLDAETVGLRYSIGFDTNPSKPYGIGVQLSFIGGSFNKFHASSGNQSTSLTLPDDQREDLGHINFTVGLRFNN